MSSSNKLERFNRTVGELETELTKLQQTTSAYSKLKELVTDYQAISAQWEENNEALSEFMEQQNANAQDAKNRFKAIYDANQEHHDLLIKQNKIAYVDLENTLRIRLEDSKSEIKRLIENERQQIQQIVDKAISEQTTTLAKKQKTTLIVLVVFAVLSLLALLLIGAKLFLKF